MAAEGAEAVDGAVKTVLVVSHNLNHEGAPLVLFEIVRTLASRGAVRPIVLAMQDGPLREDFDRLGWPTSVVRERRRLRLALELVRRRVDVVVANTVLAWWAVPVAARMGRRSIWFIHESEPDFELVPGKRDQRRAHDALGVATRVVFPSHATRAVYDWRAERPNFTVLHNGFDAAEYAARAQGRTRAEARRALALPDDRVVGLTVGTVSARKSQRDALLALLRAPRAIVDRTTLLIVGDVPGDASDDLHALAAKLPTESVRIVPYTADPVNHFLAADFALSTSRMEAFPRFIQEAMFFGLPIIAAPVFGIAEQVVDGVSALLFRPGDVEALAHRLATIVGSAELRARLGHGARAALNALPTTEEVVDVWASWPELS